jgi:hypothetical protein
MLTKKLGTGYPIWRPQMRWYNKFKFCRTVLIQYRDSSASRMDLSCPDVEVGMATSSDAFAAVDHKSMPRHEGRTVRREKHDSVGDLL